MPGAIWHTTDKTGIRIFRNIMETAMSLRLKSLGLESQHCLLPPGWHVPLTSHNWVFIPSVWSVLWLFSQFSRSVVSNSLQPHGLQCTRPPCPSPAPGVYSNSCPLSRWCHPTISSSVVPSPPAFNLSQHQSLFKWVSFLHQVDKVLEFQLQHQSFQWIFRFPLGWTGLISLQSKGLSRVFSITTFQKHQFSSTQFCL